MPREINLLPPSRRQFLNRRARIIAVQRFVVSVLFGLVLLTASGLVTIGGFRYLAASASQSVSAELDEKVSEFRRIRDSVSSDNAFIEATYDVQKNRIVWSAFLMEVFKALPPGVSISELSGTAEGRFTFRGRADSRNLIVVLEKSIADLPMVTSVDAPHTNLIQRTDSEYTFNVTLKERAGSGKQKPAVQQKEKD